jgi:hypothetical protein
VAARLPLPVERGQLPGLLAVGPAVRRAAARRPAGAAASARRRLQLAGRRSGLAGPGQPPLLAVRPVHARHRAVHPGGGERPLGNAAPFPDRAGDRAVDGAAGGDVDAGDVPLLTFIVAC